MAVVAVPSSHSGRWKTRRAKERGSHQKGQDYDTTPSPTRRTRTRIVAQDEDNSKDTSKATEPLEPSLGGVYVVDERQPLPAEGLSPDGNHDQESDHSNNPGLAPSDPATHRRRE